MDLTVWDMLQGILSWSARLLFWPLGLVIKYREFFGTVLPYLLSGVITLIVGTAILVVLGSIFRWALLMADGVLRIFKTLVIGGLGSSYKRNGPQPADHSSDPYHVLGVSRHIGEDELLARYKQLLQANHPDKVAHLDPKIQAFATTRSQKIIQAYKAVRVAERA